MRKRIPKFRSEVEAIVDIESKFGVRVLATKELHPAFMGSMLDTVAFLKLAGKAPGTTCGESERTLS